MDRRSSFLIVLLFAAILSLPWIGERPFYTRGEPREALVPQKMLETDNWILPRTFDNRVPSKPPFTHWMMGLSAQARGLVTGHVALDEWSSRLPAALFSIAFLAVFFRGIQSRLGTERALHSSLILLTSTEWLRGMVSTRVDTVLSVLLGMALLSLYFFCEKRSLTTLLLAIISLTAATLTKGPVALALPAALTGAFLLFEKRQILRSFQLGFQVFLPALILSAVWYMLAWQVGGDDFFNKFWYENVERFASSTDDQPHNHSVFYLLLMLLVGMLPWSLLTVWPGFVSLRQSERQGRLKKWWKSLHALERFSFLVVTGFFLFFSIPASKRGVYLLPSFPFAALLLSRLTVVESVSRGLRLTITVLALVATSALAALSLGVLLAPRLLKLNALQLDLFAIEQAQLVYRPISWALLLMTAFFAWYLLKSPARGSQFFMRAGFFLCALCAWIQGPVVTGFAEAVSEQRLAAQVRQLDQSLPLFGYEFEFYGTIFYTGRAVSLQGWKDAPRGIMLVKERDYKRFVDEFGDAGEQKIVAESPGSVIKVGDRILIVDFSRQS